MKRDTLITYLDEYLGAHTMQDYSDNGLQVEGSETVERLACAVDTCQETIAGALDAGAQMLIVHHGLFWGKPLRLVGPHRRRVQALLDAGCSLYAAHLPLDRHPVVGNNAQLARLLNLTVTGSFGDAFGMAVGVLTEAPPGVTRDLLAAHLTSALGPLSRMLPGGPPEVHRVGIISGSAAGDISAAAAAGCDTFITGETSHAHFHDAAEYGLNVIYAGHYATETLGVRALAGHLAERFGLPWTFVDRPTGL